MVERGRIFGKVRYEDVETSIVVIISGADAHSRLRDTIQIVGGTRQDRNVFEGAVPLVVIQDVRCGIAGDIDIRIAIVIEIRDHNTETIIRRTTHEDACCFGDVSKRSVTLVSVKDVGRGRQSPRTAKHGDVFPYTILVGATLWRLPNIEVNVVCHK